MKGMMVTLLLLGMTGTVSAQQFGKDDFAFGGSNPARPAPDQNDFLTTGRDGGGVQRSNLLQLALPLDRDVIADLRQNGERSAPIGRPAETGEVVFGFAKPLEEAKDSDNFKIVKPVAADNGALIFEFTDSDLRAVETGTLRYRFDPSEIGRYDSIVVRMRGTQLQNAPFQSPVSTDQFANIQGQRDIQPPDENPDWDTRRNTMGDDPLRPNDRFRSTPSTIPDRSLPSTVPNRFALNDKTSTTPGLNVFTPEREPQTNNWKTDSQRQTTDVPPSFEATQRRAEYLARMQDARDSELRIREQQLAEQERLLLAEQQRLQRIGGASSASTWNTDSASPSRTTPFSSGTAPLSSTDNRFASTALGMRPVDNYQSNGMNSNSDTNLQNLTNVVLDGFNSLKQSNLDLNHRIQAIESQQRNSDPAPFTTAGQQSATGTGFPDRSSRNFTPAISGYQAQIPGAERDLATNQNMTGPIYFMLICSLGLNIYLGLISRNFYVRYNELADELRETFSASISN